MMTHPIVTSVMLRNYITGLREGGEFFFIFNSLRGPTKEKVFIYVKKMGQAKRISSNQCKE